MIFDPSESLVVCVDGMIVVTSTVVSVACAMLDWDAESDVLVTVDVEVLLVEDCIVLEGLVLLLELVELEVLLVELGALNLLVVELEDSLLVVELEDSLLVVELEDSLLVELTA